MRSRIALGYDIELSCRGFDRTAWLLRSLGKREGASRELNECVPSFGLGGASGLDAVDGVTDQVGDVELAFLILAER